MWGMKRVNKKYISILAATLLALSIIFTGCASNGAEKQVKEDLNSMKNIDLYGDLTAELENELSDKGKENFEKFKALAAQYEYDIIETEESEAEDDDSIIVTVRIRTYNFGREYLRTWTEYLEVLGEDEFDQSEFYELLMENLSSLESKGYYQDVDIVCIDALGDGAWQTDVSSNPELRNAILGGMPAEMAALAES